MSQPSAPTPLGSPFLELQSVDSTNNYARQQIHAGLAQHGMAIFAHEQLSGKGQRGRSWSSEKGANIILSLVIKPHPLLLTQQFMLSACVAVATSDFFIKYAGDATKIKWPNDLYWQDRKAGGILIESVVRSGEPETTSPVARWEWSIVGIGININQTAFSSELPNPVSLKQITGKDFDVIELAKELCSYIETYFQKLMVKDYYDIYYRYVDNLYKLNSMVKLKKGDETFEAIIKSVSPFGKLIVHRLLDEDLKITEFDFGEVEWII